MSAIAHNVLIIEDDRDTGRHLVSQARAMGMTARLVTTLEEAEVALREEVYCAILVDKQIPARLGATPYTSNGDAAQRLARAVDPRRNEDDFHVLPILVITGAAAELEEARKAEFISKNFRDGASGYIPKPFDLDTVAREILDALQRAGRTSHTACAALRPKRARPRRSLTVAGTLAAELGAAAWSDLLLVAIDGHTLKVQCGATAVRRTYIDLGFASGSTRNPTDKWRIVLATCAGRGVFRGNPLGSYEAAKNAVYVTQGLLKRAFGLVENPYEPYDDAIGWRAKFRAASEVDDEK